MPDDESAEAGKRRKQSFLVAASAVSVIVLAAGAVIGLHSWSDAAVPSPAADGTPAAASSGSPLASSVASLSSVRASEPALSPAPIVSPINSSPPARPSNTASSSRHTSPPTVGAGDNQPDLKVTIEASPTHVVLGQRVHVTVTIASAGGVFDRPVEMSFGGSDPSDDFSDAQPPCTARSGSVSCPIAGLRPGHTTSFSFTFIPGPFPAMGQFDDAISAVFDYTDSYGRPQQTPQYFAHVLLFDAPASSPPPASGAPSSTPTPSATPTSDVPTSATAVP